MAGQFAVNPQTGEAVEFDGKAWKPVDKARTAVSKDGEIAVYDGKSWATIGRVGPVAQGPKSPEQEQAEYLNRDTLTPRMQLDPNAVRTLEAPVDNWATKLRGTGQAYANAALLGGADELVAGTQATFSSDPWSTFQDTLGNLQIQGGQFAAESPNLKTGADVAGIVGSPLNLLGGEFMAAGRTAPAQMGRGAVLGSTYGGAGGFLSTDGNLDQRFEGGAIGAGIGGLTGGALPLMGAIMAPAVRPEVRALIDRGVTPTPGQIMGGVANKMEERLSSFPIVGDMMAAGRRRAQEDFNVAAANDVLAPIGQTTHARPGRELIADVERRIGDEYDRILPNLTFIEDQQLGQEVAALRQTAATRLPDQEARLFEAEIADIAKKLQAGSMPGQEFKVVESQLGQRAAALRASPDAYQRQFGEMLGELQTAMRDSLPRTNPMFADQLQATNAAWANFKRLQRAATYVGGKDTEPGVFTGDQFQSAVKATDKSKDKGAFARGEARMQELSDAAKSVLGNKVPDSGTPQRLMAMIAGGGGLGFLEPATLAATGALTLPYVPAVQRALATAMTHQGPASQAMRDWALRLISPAAAGGGYIGGATATPQLPGR